MVCRLPLTAEYGIQFLDGPLGDLVHQDFGFALEYQLLICHRHCLILPTDSAVKQGLFLTFT